ncbi:hypothetical protein J6590_012632 [Homalodisca vitripennis]|nr:hypothetical protein J6590_012632 [Homalodisca vitripennis]
MVKNGIENTDKGRSIFQIIVPSTKDTQIFYSDITSTYLDLFLTSVSVLLHNEANSKNVRRWQHVMNHRRDTCIMWNRTLAVSSVAGRSQPAVSANYRLFCKKDIVLEVYQLRLAAQREVKGRAQMPLLWRKLM